MPHKLTPEQAAQIRQLLDDPNVPTYAGRYIEDWKPRTPAMDYSRFTDRARRVMQLANQEAQRLNHEYIGTEHVLLGLVKEGYGIAANVLKTLGCDLAKLRAETEKVVAPGSECVTMGKLPLTPQTKRSLELALEEAAALGRSYVGSEHLLLGLLRNEKSVACVILEGMGVTGKAVRDEVMALMGQPKAESMPCAVAFAKVVQVLSELSPAGQEEVLTRLINVMMDVKVTVSAKAIPSSADVPVTVTTLTVKGTP